MPNELAPVPFHAHIELLHFFLARRDVIVESLQGLLNAQRRPVEYLRDTSGLSRLFEDCFFTLPGITERQSRLRGQLEAAHWASGFKPREMPDMYNGLIDPAEIMTRVFHLWQQTRWPGHNGRVRYAETLFNLYVIRCLEFLSLRLWDAGAGSCGDRLSQLQGVLDQLSTNSRADQPVFVRDARWLIQLAQSPATDDLGAYFEVAQSVAETLPPHDRIEIQKAGVRMTGGHLRSQIRYLSVKNGVSLDEPSLVLSTRTSNALDFALAIQDLVPLLVAYEHACHAADTQERLELAGVICQGISADPELFVNRIALLAAYSMIEPLFIATTSDGEARYTSTGERHVRLVQEYEALMGRLSKPLAEDCAHFRPVAGVYSPYGVLYGFTSHLLEHMALKASQPDAVTRFSLEDVFANDDAGGGKLDWVSGWRKLPHLTREVQQQFDYPQQFAEDIFDRLEHALRRRAADGETNPVLQSGRLFIVPDDVPGIDSTVPPIADLPARYVASSDAQMVAAQKAVFCDEPRLSTDRREGKYLLAYRTPGGSVALTKDLLTEVLGAGRDVKVAGLPASAIRALTLMSPRLVILAEGA